MTRPLTWISAFVCVLIVLGVLNRRRKKVHIPLMVSALAIDLGIVLYLELTRALIESIPNRPMTGLLIFHITLSCIVLALYGCQVYTGIKNARGQRSAWHARIPIWFILARFGNLITSYFVTTPG